MWCLDPANSGQLLAAVHPHWRQPAGEVMWIGEGWRRLAEECHARLIEEFPNYELLNVKQSHGTLDYTAFPRPWESERATWSTDELRRLSVITDDIRHRSETTCEWCGEPRRLREQRELELTLCDACDTRFSDPPTPGKD